MINLATYEKLQHAILNGVNRVKRLEILHDQIIEFQYLIFSSAVRGDIEYETACIIDELQAPLENLTEQINSEISGNKRSVDDWNNELRNKIFLEAE